eukprot:5168451-Amphidinium_carterae.1
MSFAFQSRGAIRLQHALIKSICMSVRARGINHPTQDGNGTKGNLTLGVKGGREVVPNQFRKEYKQQFRKLLEVGVDFSVVQIYKRMKPEMVGDLVLPGTCLLYTSDAADDTPC